jgi:beta-lactamase class A
MPTLAFVLSLLFLLPTPEFAETGLQRQVAAIASSARGKVAVACALTGSSLNCDLNPRAHPPMQSVFKIPLAITALHLIEKGRWSLEQPIRFQASDRILPRTVSPLQEKYPHAEVDVPFRELLRLAIVESDNAAADVILRTIGGPRVVDDYLSSLGIRGFHLQDDEAAVDRNPALQYRNWFEPLAAVELLRLMAEYPPIHQNHVALLFDWMRDTPKGPSRIKGRLPAGTVVMHKPGSSDTSAGVTCAWNDIGLVVLPDGRRLAIAIFLTDSAADEATRDAVVARIARAAYDTAVETRR